MMTVLITGASSDGAGLAKSFAADGHPSSHAGAIRHLAALQRQQPSTSAPR